MTAETMLMRVGLGALRSAAAPVIDHRFFGPVRASGYDRDGWLWESLELLDTPRGRVDLSFTAGLSGPGPEHRSQLDTIISRIGPLTRASASMVLTELARHLGCPPDDRLEWRGAHLTDREGEFGLEYSCGSWPASMIVVWFEQSRPVSVRLDD